MITKAIFSFLFICPFLAYAQQEEASPVTEKVWRVKFLNPSIEREIPISPSFTLSTSAGMMLTYLGGSMRDGWQYAFNPFLEVQPRWFII